MQLLDFSTSLQVFLGISETKWFTDEQKVQKVRPEGSEKNPISLLFALFGFEFGSNFWKSHPCHTPRASTRHESHSRELAKRACEPLQRQ